MIQSFSRHPQHSARPKLRKQRHPYAQLHPDANPEAILREIAFVLKMTEKVRADIEVDQEAQKPMLA
jgi:hypothetical protein